MKRIFIVESEGKNENIIRVTQATEIIGNHLRSVTEGPDYLLAKKDDSNDWFVEFQIDDNVECVYYETDAQAVSAIVQYILEEGKE